MYFSSRLFCPLRFQGLPQTYWRECFLVFGNFSLRTPFPGRISVPTSFVSFFIFYILSYLLSKTMGCLSGCLMSSASIQKSFCGIFSAFKCSFVEFVGEKVVSLSYSSTILGPPFSLFLIEYLVWRSEFILFLAMNYTFVQLIIFKKSLWNSYGWWDKTS